MKKLLVALLVLSLAFSVFACASTPETPSGDAPPAGDTPAAGGDAPVVNEKPPAPEGDGSSPYPNANPDGSINLDTIAHFDVNYDYSQNEKIKCAYIAQDGGPLYQQSAVAYEHWSSLYNMEWAGFVSSNNDPDLYMTSLQNLLDQGVRAFILDPDGSIMPAVADLMKDYPDAAYMTQMAPPRDGLDGEGVPPGGNMINNYVGFDNYGLGIQVTQRLMEWKEENIPDVPLDEIGFMCLANSTSPPLNERVNATRDTWIEIAGSDANFFVADTAAGGFSLQAGIDAASPIITTNTDYKYWLVNGLIDDFSQAAASVIDQQGLTDNSAVICVGGSGLQMQWDAGQFDSFRYALFTAQNLYAEPIIGAVYAFLQGWATPDSIWPSWVKWDDHGTDGHTYSQLRLPTVWLEPDTYKHYLAWTDMYANANAYPTYSHEGISIDDYSSIITEVPPEYKAP